jgi:hypothetical protein
MAPLEFPSECVLEVGFAMEDRAALGERRHRVPEFDEIHHSRPACPGHEAKCVIVPW